jgi:uncharacterized protein YndB with AHSA1/START domain
MMPDRLLVQLTGTSDITFSRSFAAPPPVLWRALTDPLILPRWLWARDWPMVDCTMDLRVGGSFRWVWQTAPNRVVGVSGRFLAIEAPARLTHTELFDEDWTGGETTVTQTLTETAPGTTRLTMVVHYATPAARDAAAATPMAEGMEDGYRKLDGLLASLT